MAELEEINPPKPLADIVLPIPFMKILLSKYQKVWIWKKHPQFYVQESQCTVL